MPYQSKTRCFVNCDVWHIAAIVAITPRLTPITGILVVLIAIIGSLATWRQVDQLFRTAMAQKLMAQRLEEGQKLLGRTRSMMGPSVDELLAWNALTESNLKKYTDEGHVARFGFAGYLESPSFNFNTDTLRAKVRVLDEYLKQLKG